MITDLGNSAKMIGVGNIEGFSNSASDIFGNPAGINRNRAGSLALFTTTLMNEVIFNSVSLATKTPFGTVGVGYMEGSIRNIPYTGKTDASQNSNQPFYTISAFDYRNTVIKATYENEFPVSLTDGQHQKLSVGASATQYTISYYDVFGRGYNIDLGALLEFEKISFSMAAKNVLPMFSVNYNTGAKETLPLQLVSGVKYTLFDADLMLQLKRVEGHNLASAGIIYTPRFVPFIQLLAGYKETLGPALSKPKTSGTLGLALKLDGLQFHYAYEKSEHVEFDNKNYFSISLDI